MTIDHREIAFEDAIEASLLGQGSYIHGDPDTFNRELALFPGEVMAFLEASQPETMTALREQLGDGLEKEIIEQLKGFLESNGTLDVLRHGIKVYGKKLELAYFAPASGLNPEIAKLYSLNRLAVTRQVHYSQKNENSVDILLSLNGLPIATAELKNQFSGQTVEDAKWQYKNDRDQNEPLFQFKKRALVHFAVDTDEVYMTTQLKGGTTVFLPFNRGSGTAAGNPDVKDNYKTFYLWEWVWAKDSLMDILGHFLHLQVDEKRVGKETVKTERLIFPRFHQLDVVRKLLEAAREEGTGNNYLIQHSAGSGKSNSIGWLAHRLSSLHDDNDERVFDSVIVITDRRVLDRQLQSTIYQFEHKQGVVEKIDQDSKQLGEALVSRTQIIVTTLQKFPYVLDRIADIPKQKYTVIVDEAHSSQSGEGATTMKAVLAAKDLEDAENEDTENELPDYQEELVKTMAARGKQPNISFFAFTATPKYKTLEVFGRPGITGKNVPFNLYSMRQAIEEGFILDVLKNYTTYKTYFRLVKSIEDDPLVERKKAARALARFMSLHPHNIAQKTEVMIEHFRRFTKHKIGGKAKAMVVTSSRLHAVRYKQAFDEYISKHKYTDIKTLVAFSGTVVDKEFGKTYTEVEMNLGIKESEIPDKFASGEYQVLLVAEKYQTGFDQPLLHTMYVDKRLQGLHAVQTLSRLNRIHQGKEDTFVLDFVNDADDIQEAFQPYYEQTTVSEEANPKQLYDLAKKIDEFQVYHQPEVEDFCKVFFKKRVNQTKQDHARMNALIDPAVSRFEALEEERQEEFKKLLIAYKNLYSFLAQVIPYQDSDLEKLYAYVRFLLTKLPRGDRGTQYDFEDDVALKYYRLQKISEGTIELEPGEPGELPAPTEVGTGAEKDETVELSKLVDRLNERFGTEFKPADELFFSQILQEAITNETLVEAAEANPIENFRFVFDEIVEGLFIDRMDQNEDIFGRFMNDQNFKKAVSKYLMEQVYETVRNRGNNRTTERKDEKA